MRLHSKYLPAIVLTMFVAVVWLALEAPPLQAGTGGTVPTPTPQPGEPVITSLQACFTGSNFLQGIHLGNRFTAYVDWNDTTPDRVDFTLNRQTVRVPASEAGASHTYDMGSALDYSLLGEENSLSVKAYNREGKTSASMTKFLCGIGIPAWSGGHLPRHEVRACVGNRPFVFWWTLRYPKSPFRGIVTPPRWFPYIGGMPIGILPTQAQVKVQGESTGGGYVSASGKTGFTIAGQQIKGTADGQGDVAFVCGHGLQVTSASLGIDINGLLKKTANILDVVPGLRALEKVPVIRRLARWLNRRARIVATLEPDVNLTTKFRSTESGWEWVSAQGGARVRMMLALIIRVLKRGMSVTVWGGGEPSIQFQVPPAPSYLKRISATLFAGVRIRVWRLQRTFTTFYRWTYTPSRIYGLDKDKVGTQYTFDSGWEPIPRDYSNPPSEYARFRANNFRLHIGTALRMARRNGWINTTEEQVIVSNVFPESYPSIAADNRLLLLWVHDDVNKPLMQGEEIYYSIFDGTRWTPPAAITDDNLQDFSPQVVFYGPNRALAVWERNKVVQSEKTDLTSDYSNAFEIAYSVWNGITWSQPLYLTNNDVLDHAPLLVLGQDGIPMLIWRQNPGGNLVGDPENPDTFYYTFWTGHSWEPPKVLMKGVTGALDLTAARYDSSHMGVVFGQDTDGDLGTESDQELYMLVWQNGGWIGPFQITHDEQPDNRPTLFYNNQGFPRLFWLKGQALYSMVDSLTGEGHKVTIEDSASILDYVAVEGRTGDVVFLWQAYSRDGVDVFYASYDEHAHTFNFVQQLTHDPPAETFMSADFTRSGELVMAFDRAEIVTSTIAISPTMSITNVTEFGQSDLYVLRHTFGPDLTLSSSEITFEPANPEPGTPVRLKAILRNVGDKAVIRPSVAFYLGPPEAGYLIATTTADLVLSGGMTTTVQVEWNVPGEGGPFQIFAVADPHDVVAETNETNNSANVFVSVPDLVIGDVRFTYTSGPTLLFTATVTNTGVVTSPSTAMILRVGDPVSGTVVSNSVLGPLKPGESTQVRATWITRDTPGKRYNVYAIVDPEGAIPEENENNNVSMVSVAVFPNLQLNPSGINVARKHIGKRSVSVWVFNKGPADAYDVRVRIYDRFPKRSAVPIGAGTLSWIPAGDERVVHIDLDSSQWGFYVKVDGKPGDLDLGDNMLPIGTLPHFIYLPMVDRR